MRLLVDANLSPRLLSPLRQSGHDVVHVDDIDMLTAPDIEILQIAEKAQRVVIQLTPTSRRCLHSVGLPANQVGDTSQQ